MRTFVLQRDEDVTGVSGTGIVAEGAEFTDGTVVVRWIVGDHHSTALWPDIQAVEEIHGHDGRTRIVWTGYVDEEYVTQVVHRDAGTGKFVSDKYAEEHPDTTVKETNG